jgi:hypothetical protein
MLLLHQNDQIWALSRMWALSFLFSPSHLYGSPTKQWMEWLRYILLFNQTKNRAVSFYLPNIKWNCSIIRNWNGAAPFYTCRVPLSANYDTRQRQPLPSAKHSSYNNARQRLFSRAWSSRRNKMLSKEPSADGVYSWWPLTMLSVRRWHSTNKLLCRVFQLCTVVTIGFSTKCTLTLLLEHVSILLEIYNLILCENDLSWRK